MPKELTFWIDEFIDFTIEGSVATLRLRAGGQILVMRNEQGFARRAAARIRRGIADSDKSRQESCVLPMHICPHKDRPCEGGDE